MPTDGTNHSTHTATDQLFIDRASARWLIHLHTYSIRSRAVSPNEFLPVPQLYSACGHAAPPRNRAVGSVFPSPITQSIFLGLALQLQLLGSDWFVLHYVIARLILCVSPALLIFWIPHHLLKKLNLLTGNIHFGVLHLRVLLLYLKPKAALTVQCRWRGPHFLKLT
ncbi:hypothetical protein B0H13DRAFT_2378118 [Mycena leptocephala]|nr:hypothetical protein B0H13DRAFT_2378118 [Mycena leptocephala]